MIYLEKDDLFVDLENCEHWRGDDIVGIDETLYKTKGNIFIQCDDNHGYDTYKLLSNDDGNKWLASNGYIRDVDKDYIADRIIK